MTNNNTLSFYNCQLWDLISICILVLISLLPALISFWSDLPCLSRSDFLFSSCDLAFILRLRSLRSLCGHKSCRRRLASSSSCDLGHLFLYFLLLWWFVLRLRSPSARSAGIRYSFKASPSARFELVLSFATNSSGLHSLRAKALRSFSPLELVVRCEPSSLDQPCSSLRSSLRLICSSGTAFWSSAQLVAFGSSLGWASVAVVHRPFGPVHSTN